MKYLILTLILCVVALTSLSGCTSKAPGNLGVKNGLLAPCPDRDNCVSSQSHDAAHAIEPLKAHGEPDVVMVDLASVIEEMFGGKVMKQEGNYLHAEFTSRIFRFVDDVECFYDEDAGLIQIRSASRIGYSDLNANRKRVEEIRRLFELMQK